MATKQPAKKTKAQIEAEKAAAEAAAEVERKAAEERAEVERQRLLEEERKAKELAAQRRREELERLAVEFAAEDAAARSDEEGLHQINQKLGRAKDWQSFRNGAHHDIGSQVESALSTFITQAKDADAAALARVLEGTGSLLAPPALISRPIQMKPTTDGPMSTRVMLHEVYDTETKVDASKPGSAPAGAFSPSYSVRNGPTSGFSGSSPLLSLPLSVGIGIRPLPSSPLLAAHPLPSQAHPSTGERRGEEGGRQLLSPSAPSATGRLPPVRCEELLSPFGPGSIMCTALATMCDEAERALCDALECGDAALAQRIEGFINEMRTLTYRRVDALSSELLQASSEYAVELKDGVRELHAFDHFDVVPQRAGTISTSQLSEQDAGGNVRRGFAAARVAGDLLLWGNLGPAKVLRTKTVRNSVVREKMNAKDADANSTICVDLHKHIASLPAALRVVRTDFDFAAGYADLIAVADMEARKEAGIPEDTHVGGKTSRTGRNSARSGRNSAAGGNRRASNQGAAGAHIEQEGEEADKSEEKKDDDDAKEDGDEGDEEDEEDEEGRSKAERRTVGRTARAGQDEDTSFTVGEAEKILQACSLRSFGGTVTVDLLALPPQSTIMKGWMMTRETAPLPPFHVQRVPHPAVGQGAAASAQAIKIRMRLPDHVVLPPDGKWRVGRWMRLPHSHPLCAVSASGDDSKVMEEDDQDDPFIARKVGGNTLRAAAAAAKYVLAQVGSNTEENANATDRKLAHVTHVSNVLHDSSKFAACAPGYWRVDDTLEVSFDASARTVTFSTLHMAPHALVAPRHVDMPFLGWALTPVHHPSEIAWLRRASQKSSIPVTDAMVNTDDILESNFGSDSWTSEPERKNAAVLRLHLARFTLAIMIHDDGTCRLVGPTDVPELKWLIGTDISTGADAVVVPPGQLLELLARSGIFLMPTDFDAALHGLDAQAAMSAAAAAFSSADTDKSADETGEHEGDKAASSVAFSVPDGESKLGEGESKGDEGEGDESGAADKATAGEARVDDLPAILPLPVKDRRLELNVYRDIARLSGSFAFTSSLWNCHPDTPKDRVVVRGCEVTLNPLVPGSTTSFEQAASQFLDATTGCFSKDMDHTKWRMIQYLADYETPAEVRVALVKDDEPSAAVAWQEATHNLRGQFYANLKTSTLLGSPNAAESAEAYAGSGSPPESPPINAAGTDASSFRPTVTKTYTGRLEGGNETHTTAKIVLAARSSKEAMDLVAHTSPKFVDTVDRLLALVRPLSFTQ